MSVDPPILDYAADPPRPLSRLGAASAVLALASVAGVIGPAVSLYTAPLALAGGVCGCLAATSAVIGKRTRPALPVLAMLASGVLMVIHGHLLAAHHASTVRLILTGLRA